MASPPKTIPDARVIRPAARVLPSQPLAASMTEEKTTTVDPGDRAT